VAGYIAGADFVRNGSLELLDLHGKVLAISIQEVKWVAMVRDFNSGEIDNPEKFVRKTFAGRPRSEGLWVRLHLRDGDLLEGITDNSLGLLDTDGFFLTPPDTRSNTQRVWLPRTALAELEVVAVIGATTRKKPAAAAKAEDGRQETLFPLARN